MVKIFLGILAVTVVVILVFKSIDPSQDSSSSTSSTTTTETTSSDTIKCRISGEIATSGTYVCKINSTLGDLIELAQGETSNADELAYDTSYVLQDKYEFYIAPKYKTDSICADDPITKVNINTADIETMKTVSGIGTAISTAIVNYREAGNTFERIEDIKNVSGIGNATFEKLKNYIRLRDA